MADTKDKKKKKKKDARTAERSARKQVESRVDAFAELARAAEKGVCVMLPSAFTGQDRREHVRATLREDHATRISDQASGTRDKFEKLAGSVFSFFRGTALLFYRDMAGMDRAMPTVLVLGDVHPENFGVMPNADNVPIFAVNDFDEVCYAPFTWDLKRGAVGFLLAAKEEGGLGRKKRRKVIRRFVEGYISEMKRFAKHETEKSEEYRPDNSPKIIRRLFEEAEQNRKEWLWDRYLDESKRGFRANFEFTPISSRKDEFQKLVYELGEKNGMDVPERAGELRVKDVAMRHGQGTSSLGLPRYYVLIEGPSKDATDDIIVEFKRARRSALHGLVPRSPYDAGERGDRIAHGQAVHLSSGDVFYGSVELEGASFMTRERAPFRDDIDLDDLSYKSWRHYARACGRVLAQAHALSDDAGELDYDIEPSIVEATDPPKLFIADIIRFAEEAEERLRADHALFAEDFEMGAFDRIDMEYR